MLPVTKILHPFVYLLITLPPDNDNEEEEEDGSIGPRTRVSYGWWSREPVKDRCIGNQLVGYKKFYIHDDKSGKDTGNGWFMTEFYTLQPTTDPHQVSYVLCKIEKIYYYNDATEEEEEEVGEEELELELDPESATKATEDAAVAALVLLN